eukprot:scaffold7684_cov119-Isochrysis_galbana.AAC.14
MANVPMPPQGSSTTSPGDGASRRTRAAARDGRMCGLSRPATRLRLGSCGIASDGLEKDGGSTTPRRTRAWRRRQNRHTSGEERLTLHSGCHEPTTAPSSPAKAIDDAACLPPRTVATRKERGARGCAVVWLWAVGGTPPSPCAPREVRLPRAAPSVWTAACVT